MSDIAIKFENVSKMYRLGLVGTGTLSHDIRRWWITSVRGKEDPYLKIGETNDRASKGQSDYVYALKDIDFEVHQGDVLGIIGKNGAGKSTLLKLLSRVTYPTTGKIYTKGRIASLLEVGTGFHPELTGRENIYMNGSILGMKKWEIDKQLDAIVDFSGCERYLDTPTKRYSSGMTVRLGFAIAAHLNPEILVVDEVLAVGDAEFQKKAIGKMQDVSRGEGRTVLFVSHNMASIRQLCATGLLLENGMIKATGEANAICDKYLSDNIPDLDSVWNKELDSTKKFQLYRAEMCTEEGANKSDFSCDENVILKLHFNVTEKIPGIYGYLSISKKDGSAALVSDSNDSEMNHLEKLPMGKSIVEILIPKRSLNAGTYTVYINFTSKFNIQGWNVESPKHICSFSLSDDRTVRGNSRGGYFSTILPWNILDKK